MGLSLVLVLPFPLSLAHPLSLISISYLISLLILPLSHFLSLSYFLSVSLLFIFLPISPLFLTLSLSPSLPSCSTLCHFFFSFFLFLHLSLSLCKCLTKMENSKFFLAGQLLLRTSSQTFWQSLSHLFVSVILDFAHKGNTPISSKPASLWTNYEICTQ